VRLTGRGWGVVGASAVLLVVAVVLDRREALYIALFLLLLSILALVTVRLQRPRLRVRRTFTPTSVSVGETAMAHAVLESSGPMDAVSGWREEVPAEFGPMPQGELPAYPRLLRDGYRVTLDYELWSTARGRFEVGPFFVSHGDPFGLVVAEKPIGERRTLVVTPEVTPLVDTGTRTASGEGASKQRQQHTNPRADELIAREYRPGDPLRRVHWRQTARKGELMVRQEEQQGDPEVCLLLETTRPSHRTGDGATSSAHFERMVELAASVGVLLSDAGNAIALIETAVDEHGDGRVRPRVSHLAPGGSAALLEVLAESRRAQVPDGYDVAAALAPVVRRSGRAVPVFAILGAVSAMSARRLASLKVHAEPAVAFLEHADQADPLAPGTAAGILADSGWRITPFTANTEVDDAWAAVVRRPSEREGRRAAG